MLISNSMTVYSVTVGPMLQALSPIFNILIVLKTKLLVYDLGNMEGIIESPVIAASIDREDKKNYSRECFISGESSNGKSDEWTVFSHVLYANTDKRTGYVSCNKCKIVLSNLPGTGTSHLKRHKCAVVTKGNASRYG